MAQEFYEDRDREEGRRIGGFSITPDRSLVFDRDRRVILLTRERLLPEDIVAFRFAKVLEEGRVSYVVVAGYTAILFGRGRRSDDIDFIVEELDEKRFMELCMRARKAGFTLMQGDIWSEDSVKRLYRDYLVKGYGVRFMYRDIVLPNVEVKLAKTSIHRYALTHRIKVVVNDRFVVRISPLELQIAYKLYLGSGESSGKDFGDAVFLYTLFKDYIDRGELERWCTRLRVDCRVLEEAGKP